MNEMIHVLQTQNSKFEPWWSEAEHATSRYQSGVQTHDFRLSKLADLTTALEPPPLPPPPPPPAEQVIYLRIFEHLWLHEWLVNYIYTSAITTMEFMPTVMMMGCDVRCGLTLVITNDVIN